MDTFDDVFAAFGGPARLAEATGLRPFHAQTMKQRGSIPPAYWTRVVSAAERLNIDGVTTEKLAVIAAARRPASRHQQVARCG